MIEKGMASIYFKFLYHTVILKKLKLYNNINICTMYNYNTKILKMIYLIIRLYYKTKYLYK